MRALMTMCLVACLASVLVGCKSRESTLADPSQMPTPEQVNAQRAALPPSPCKDCPPAVRPMEVQAAAAPAPMAPQPTTMAAVVEPTVKFEWWPVPGNCGRVGVRDANTKERFGEFALPTGEWGPGADFDAFIRKDPRYADQLTHGSGSQKLNEPPTD